MSQPTLAGNHPPHPGGGIYRHATARVATLIKSWEQSNFTTLAEAMKYPGTFSKNARFELQLSSPFPPVSNI